MKEIIQFISHHLILSTVWVSLLIALLFTIAKELASKVEIITCSEATRLINREDAIVVDLRKQNDYQKGHIAGSINLFPLEIKENNISKLKKYRNRSIIIVDCTDIHAQKSANALIKADFKKVYILKRGILGWNNENLPLVQSK